jgi:hypothetical protein
MSKKPLNIIHISRCGGQTVIRTFLNNRTEWNKPKNYATPLYFLPKEEKDAYDWFIIVRNPYLRIIAGYAWCHRYNIHNQNIGDKDYFNQFLVKWITNATNPLKEKMYVPPDSNYNPLYMHTPYTYYHKGEDHFIECYKYIDLSYPMRILRSEALEEDFNALMKEYGYTFTLGPTINDLPEKPMSVSDLYPETIELIKTVYAKDFELFGYSTDPAKAADVPPIITFNQQQ